MSSRFCAVPRVGMAFAVLLAVAAGGCGSSDRGQRGAAAPAAADAGYFTGSRDCRDCHEDFYRKWSTSHHGLAMRPYSEAFARSNLVPQAEALRIGPKSYRYVMEKGVVHEEGPAGSKDYAVVHVMGGKNVFYFLTLLEKGKLQVLPVAYDVKGAFWYDTAGSAVRHFADRLDEALDWTDRLYTFNTSCFDCHVSQLATRYDPASDSYQTTWLEPGINCETCHGPGSEHVKLARATPANQPLPELRIIDTRRMTHDQRNDMCSPCHAKMSPLTKAYTPGERYFDHFDLVGLEHEDFYPDGRDLGENYTLTTWRLNPCMKKGGFDCVHCHTSSGRMRFTGADANKACLPCHEDRVKNAPAHTHHPEDGPGNRCVSCHMPMTRFANMNRSDHSMRPPMPEAAARFGSDLACLICHTNQKLDWAHGKIREWHPGNSYPEETLYWGGLVDEARKGNWSRLPAMAEYVSRTNREEAAAAALGRLSISCPDPAKWPMLVRLAESDPSPWVRASAVDAMGGGLRTPGVVKALLKAARDDYRLVRLRAASVLAPLPRTGLAPEDLASLEKATAELEESLRLRPDNEISHYNLGNYYMARQDTARAAAAFEQSVKLRPETVPSRVNLAFAYNAMGRNEDAERHLREAVSHAPSNAVVQLNFALLLGEVGKMDEARAAFERTLRLEPTNAVAAYNLGVIAAQAGRIADGVAWSRKASEWNPAEPRYAYTHAFYLLQGGNPATAGDALEALLRRSPDYEPAWPLLVEARAKAGDRAAAAAACRRALDRPGLSPETRAELEARRRALEPSS